MESLEEINECINNLNTISNFDKKIKVIKELREKLINHQEKVKKFKVNLENEDDLNDKDLEKLSFHELKDKFNTDNLEDKINIYKTFCKKIIDLENNLFEK